MILHVAYSGVGGTGSFVADLCPRLLDKNQKSTVIFYGVEPLHADYGQRLRDAGVPYLALEKRPGLDLSSLQDLARAIRRCNPDAIVMHGGGTAWHWPLVRLMGVSAPMVLVEHGPEISWSVPRHIIGILCSRTVIAVSEALADSVKARFRPFLGTKPLVPIQNGIDTEFFCPARHSRSPHTVLMAATMSPVKDQATLISAVALLADRYPIQLLFAGDGTTRSDMEKLARDSGVGDRITFLGNIGRRRLLGLYQTSTLLAYSTRGEGTSLAILEAMACGLPVVASDAPGVREVLTGRECAILVPVENPAEMAGAIERVLVNPGLASRMGDLARQYVVSNYSAQRTAAGYFDLLRHFES